MKCSNVRVSEGNSATPSIWRGCFSKMNSRSYFVLLIEMTVFAFPQVTAWRKMFRLVSLCGGYVAISAMLFSFAKLER